MSRFALFLLLNLVAAFAAPTAQAGDPVNISVRGENRKMTRKECARKAVEAIGVNEKFPLAELTKDGNAQGWSADVAVHVLSYPMPDPDRVFIVAIAVGSEGSETNRVVQSVADHVMNGPANPDTPARIAPAEGKNPPRPFTLICKSEEQGTTPVLRHFGSAATIVLEKKGYQTTALSKDFIGGLLPGDSLPDRCALAFVAPTTRATSARLSVVYAMPGEESGETAADDLLVQIVKILYE